MGWFWNKSSSSSNQSTDPLRDLDPSLRDFLSKESPVKYKPAPTPPPPAPAAAPPPAQVEESKTPAVPPESLYQDGRYADLWSTYRPLSAIEADSKSDQEKLTDVLEGYKARKAQIGRAAVENCVIEEMKIKDCYKHGSYMDKLRMCHAENQAFERCYSMQSRFLKALGYLSTYNRPAEVDEKIQMHADTLYHRMLAQEKAIEEAKAAGQPIPQFESIMSSEDDTAGTTSDQEPVAGTAPTLENAATPSPDTQELPSISALTKSLLNPESQMKLREKMREMTPMEREIEERSVQMEARNAGEIAEMMREVEQGRKKRREEGNATVADSIAGLFGW